MSSESPLMEAVRKPLAAIWNFFAPYYNYIFLFSYLFIGYAFYNAYEGWGLEMAFGFMIVTISTVGRSIAAVCQLVLIVYRLWLRCAVG